MDKIELLRWLERDEEIITKLSDEAEKSDELTSFYAGNLNYIQTLRDAIEEGLFNKD
ncbi:hypothetical protein HRF87_04780 [Bacillus sp. CRN 9]|nr:hypothetical protein [Bacillus sp. CRN 9]